MTLSKDDLRKAQLLMLKILKEVHRICEKNGIHYFLSDGTLIGAIRHNGFIPWDDDLDVGMLRSDYEKFKAAVQTELAEEFIFQSVETDKGCALPFAKVMLKNTKWLEAATQSKKTRRDMQGIYIDVFPYDKIPADLNIQKKHYWKFRFWQSIIVRKDKYFGIAHSKGFVRKLIFCAMKTASFFIPLKLCVKKRDFLCSKYEYLTDDFVVTKYGGNFYRNQNPYEAFARLVPHRFEDSDFYVPAAYDSILTKLYGNYMELPPAEKRQNHGIYQYDFGRY